MESPLSSPVIAPVTGPRYRYFQKPPAAVSLRAGDLLAEVPDAARAKGFVAERIIELPAGEIFQGPTPRIALDRLAEIAPECFRSTGFQIFVRLPAGKLALGYQLIAERELIPEDPPPYLPPPEFLPEGTASEEPVASAGVEAETLVAPIPPAPAQIIEPAPLADEEAPARTQRLTPLRTPQPVSFKPAPAQPEAPVEPPVNEAPPPEDASFRSPVALPKAPASIRPAKEPSSPETAPSAEQVPPPKRPFTVLPLFRRKSAETQQVSPAPQVPPPPRRRIELPPPRVIVQPVATPAEGEPVAENLEPPPPSMAEQSPEPHEEETVPSPVPPENLVETFEPPVPEPIQAEEQVLPPPAPPVSAPLAEELPPPPPATPVYVAPEPPEPVIPQPEPEPEPSPAMTAPVVMAPTEHLAKASSQLPSQDDLQALFMTEETLSVDRVVELCGGLPGINSCVLSHGAAVIASHNVPDSIDLISLSAHALEMLGAMRSSSARMGIGAIPAVTLHSEKGPITFFHREDLCFLVLHKDRGFVPGVREKLQRVVDELSKARLPRPLPSKPRTLPAE